MLMCTGYDGDAGAGVSVGALALATITATAAATAAVFVVWCASVSEYVYGNNVQLNYIFSINNVLRVEF